MIPARKLVSLFFLGLPWAMSKRMREKGQKKEGFRLISDTYQSFLSSSHVVVLNDIISMQSLSRRKKTFLIAC